MTSGYLLDTNILGYLVRALSNDKSSECINVLQHYQKHESDALMFICSATVGEIEYGLNSGSQPYAVQCEARGVLEQFPDVLNIDKHVATDNYATLRAELFRKYAPKTAKGTAKTRHIEQWNDPITGFDLGIDENDIWIAAVALTHNLTLVSNDKMNRISSIAPPRFSTVNWAK